MWNPDRPGCSPIGCGPQKNLVQRTKAEDKVWPSRGRAMPSHGHKPCYTEIIQARQLPLLKQSWYLATTPLWVCEQPPSVTLACMMDSPPNCAHHVMADKSIYLSCRPSRSLGGSKSSGVTGAATPLQIQSKRQAACL